MDKDWGRFYERTKNDPPSPLLVEALTHVKTRDSAIDIGAGGLKDTRYLLEEGFEVTVVDMEPLMAKAAAEIKTDKLEAVVSSFADFDFGKDKYDIAAAMYALPFNPRDTFDSVFARIKESLITGGVFCGQLFGDRDAWTPDPQMTFHDKAQAQALFSDMELLTFKETEKDGKTADGTPKHWHVFHFIARKK